jgi:S1-C subfamily serine protease
MASDVAAQDKSMPPESPENCSLDPTEIYTRTEKRVWGAMTLHIDPMRLAERVQAGRGSAIALGDGHFVTNYHVVGKSDVVMLMSGKHFVPATVVGRDPALDIAVLYSPEDEFMRLSEPLPFVPDVLGTL